MMRLKRALLACCALLLSAGSIQSQSDRLSGNWGADGKPFLALRYDGKSAVSGVAWFRGSGRLDSAAIKSGTFNPATGAFKIEGDAKKPDGAPARFVIEGKLDGDAIAGTYTHDIGKGDFTFTRLGAPQAGGNEAATALRKGFMQVSGFVAKSADLVPAEKYTYRPTQSVRTFGQLIGHIADSYNYYCAQAAGRNAQWSDAIEKGNTSKAVVVAKLKQAADGCAAGYAGATHAGALVENVGHTNLHYGNIITYMRMLGLTPPSS